MPFINTKVTGKVSAQKKDQLTKALTGTVDVLGKTEDWVMVDIEDSQDLYFAGKKKDAAAFVGVQLVGSPNADASLAFIKKLCTVLKEELDIPKDSVYITITPVEGYHWGWNDQAF